MLMYSLSERLYFLCEGFFLFPLSVKVSDDLFSLLNVFNCVPLRYHNRFILISGKINMSMCQSAIRWIVFCEMFRIFTQLNRDSMQENSITLSDDNISTARPYFISISLMSFSVT